MTADAASAHRIEVVSPLDGTSIGQIPCLDAEAVASAVREARAAQVAWAELSVKQRAQQLGRFRDALYAARSDLVDAVEREVGKPRVEALGHEVVALLDALGWVLRRAPRLLKPRRIALHLLVHRSSEVRHVPRGVIGILAPWNFPLLLPVADAVAALVAGNAVVIKPSEYASLSLLLAQRLWAEAGLDPRLFSVVTGDARTGAHLVASGVDKLHFTGSVAAGRQVALGAAERLTEVTLELGGKAPLIAWADAPLERTAQAIRFGGFVNSGQACVAVERVYAHSDIYEPLLARTAELTRALCFDLGRREIAPLVMPGGVEHCERLVEDALAKGARLVLGGQRRAGPGRFFEPTILADCDHGMAVMREETFGPIVPFMRVTEAASALNLANDSELGLSAYVFTASRERAEWFAARLAAGSVVINDVVTHRATPEAPFGGVKRSGYGRVLGDDGLLAFCHVQHVSRPRVPSLPRDPFWFPYDETSLRVLGALLELVGTGKNPLVRGWRALRAAFAKPIP